MFSTKGFIFSQKIIISLVLFSCFSYPVRAQKISVLEEIKRTGLLKIAVREDAVPFGYRDNDDNWTGVCIDFVEILRNQVRRELDQPIILVKLFKSTLFNRFELVNDKVVALECGPNTIRDNLSYKIDFSDPFFLTGTQFLIKAEDKNRIRLNTDLRGITIGGLQDSTNLEFVATKYPLATIRKFQGVTGRQRGVQALRQGKIDAFVSDGILLIGEALLQNLSLGQNYVIFPEYPLQCEQYGMILPNNDSQWRELVNKTIATKEAQTLYQKWIDPILPAIEQTRNYCRQPENNQIPKDSVDSK
jgi:polar amino acid transport system substrate-binding protein